MYTARGHPVPKLPPYVPPRAGSHLMVQPHNPPHLVESTLQLLGLTGLEPVEWTPAVTTEAAASGCKVSPFVISSRQAVMFLADLSAVPTRRQVSGSREDEGLTDCAIDYRYYYYLLQHAGERRSSREARAVWLTVQHVYCRVAAFVW